MAFENIIKKQTLATWRAYQKMNLKIYEEFGESPFESD